MREMINTAINSFTARKQTYEDNLVATALIDEFILHLQIMLHEMNQEELKSAGGIVD